MYREKYNLGPIDASDDEEVEFYPSQKKPIKTKQGDDSDSDDELSTRVSILKAKLEDESLNKNQRKNCRRKLKRLEEKLEKQ